jgi:DNA-binding response OmpR family regulator
MPARILIVDDDESYLAGVKEWLEAAGYETIVAKTYEDGKRALAESSPHLVIVDIRLGAFNGLQLISSTSVKTPAIVVTGFEDPVLRSDAAAFGASYLVKPVVPSELLAMIQQQLAPLSAAG